MDTGRRTATRKVTSMAKPLPERRLVATSLNTVDQDMARRLEVRWFAREECGKLFTVP